MSIMLCALRRLSPSCPALVMLLALLVSLAMCGAPTRSSFGWEDHVAAAKPSADGVKSTEADERAPFPYLVDGEWRVLPSSSCAPLSVFNYAEGALTDVLRDPQHGSLLHALRTAANITAKLYALSRNATMRFQELSGGYASGTLTGMARTNPVPPANTVGPLRSLRSMTFWNMGPWAQSGQRYVALRGGELPGRPSEGATSADRTTAWLATGIMFDEQGKASMVLAKSAWINSSFALYHFADVATQIYNITVSRQTRNESLSWPLERCFLLALLHSTSSLRTVDLQGVMGGDPSMQGAFHGHVLSTCGLCWELKATASENVKRNSSAVFYAVLLLLAGVCHLAGMTVQHQFVNDSDARIQRMNVWTMYWLAFMDLHTCALITSTTVELPLTSKAFLAAQFPWFLCFALYTYPFSAVLARARATNADDHGRITRLQLMFWVFAITSMGPVVALRWSLAHWTVLLGTFSFFVPQVVHNFQKEDRVAWQTPSLLLIAMGRAAPIVYLFGYEGNFAQCRVDLVTAIGVPLWLAVQCAVLWMQARFGPQFMVPSFLRAPRYSYAVTTNAAGLEEDAECAICKTEMKLCDAAAPLWVTPCHHYFHAECLQRWMDQRLECPLCRAKIPSP